MDETSDEPDAETGEEEEHLALGRAENEELMPEDGTYISSIFTSHFSSLALSVGRQGL